MPSAAAQALIKAVQRGNLSTVAMLLEAGAATEVGDSVRFFYYD